MSTTKVRTLAVSFTETIKIQELECFRGAVAEKVGLDREFFHNHNNDKATDNHYHYRYPLVQYRLKRSCPQLLFINEAIDEARHFFAQPDWSLNMAGRPYHSKIDQLKANQVDFGLIDEQKEYYLSNWLALNTKNHEAYGRSEDMHQKINILEGALAGHILSLANGINYQFPARFGVSITDFIQRRFVHYKGVTLLSFDLAFKANVALPLGFSIGKGSSLGFGRVRSGEVRKRDEENLKNKNKQV